MVVNYKKLNQSYHINYEYKKRRQRRTLGCITIRNTEQSSRVMHSNNLLFLLDYLWINPRRVGLYFLNNTEYISNSRKFFLISGIVSEQNNTALVSSKPFSLSILSIPSSSDLRFSFFFVRSFVDLSKANISMFSSVIQIFTQYFMYPSETGQARCRSRLSGIPLLVKLQNTIAVPLVGFMESPSSGNSVWPWPSGNVFKY